MRVKQLIELLQQCNQEAKVIMSADSEGNAFAPLDEVDAECLYSPEGRWGEGVLWDEESLEIEYGEEEDWPEGLEPAVGLWP